MVNLDFWDGASVSLLPWPSYRVGKSLVKLESGWWEGMKGFDEIALKIKDKVGGDLWATTQRFGESRAAVFSYMKSHQHTNNPHQPLSPCAFVDFHPTYLCQIISSCLP